MNNVKLNILKAFYLQSLAYSLRSLEKHPIRLQDQDTPISSS